MIHRAVVNACDALDGLQDDLIGDATRCVFDFKSLECKAQDSSSCLTAGQAQSAEKNDKTYGPSEDRRNAFPRLPPGFGTQLGLKSGRA